MRTIAIIIAGALALAACTPATPGQRSTLRPEARAVLLGGALDAITCGAPLALGALAGLEARDYVDASACYLARQLARAGARPAPQPSEAHGRLVALAEAAAQAYLADPCPETVEALGAALAACEVAP